MIYVQQFLLDTSTILFYLYNELSQPNARADELGWKGETED